MCRSVFSPGRTPRPSSLEWPQVVINQGFDDMNYMLYLQLKSVSDALASREGILLSVRANYGTGIIPSMFGAEIFRLEDRLNTLPGTRPPEHGIDRLQAIADQPLTIPKVLRPWCSSLAAAGKS